jgi:hypothetical protein
VPELPADLVFAGFWAVRGGEARGARGVCGGTEPVCAHVADGDSLTGGSGGGDGSGSLHVPCTDAAGEATADIRGSTQLSPGERAGSCYQHPRALISWSLGLEVCEHPLGTVGGPCGDQTSVGFAERLWRCHRCPPET